MNEINLIQKYLRLYLYYNQCYLVNFKNSHNLNKNLFLRKNISYITSKNIYYKF
jgi:hypothetical protein